LDTINVTATVVSAAVPANANGTVIFRILPLFQERAATIIEDLKVLEDNADVPVSAQNDNVLFAQSRNIL
jgi:hypothetical protein